MRLEQTAGGVLEHPESQTSQPGDGVVGRFQFDGFGSQDMVSVDLGRIARPLEQHLTVATDFNVRFVLRDGHFA